MKRWRAMMRDLLTAAGGVLLFGAYLYAMAALVFALSLIGETP